MPFLFVGAVASALLWGALIPFTGGIGDDVGGFFLGAGVSAVLHVVYLMVLQKGYSLGNLSTVYALARGTGPILSVVIAVTLLGERPSWIALVGVAVVILGIIAIGFVDRTPGRRSGMSPAVLAGLLTGVMIALYTIWDAFAMRTWGLSPVAFMVGCVVGEIPIFAVMLRGRFGQVRDVLKAQGWRVLAFGVLSPASYILVLTAITMAPVALVAPVREVSVVLVSVWGALVMKEGNTARRVGAAVVVCLGIALLAL